MRGSVAWCVTTKQQQQKELVGLSSTFYNQLARLDEGKQKKKRNDRRRRRHRCCAVS